jgi:hypothetical protein
MGMHGLGKGRIGGGCVALGLIATLGACALSDRAENLYHRQHRVAAALAETIVANEERDPQLADSLYGAETDLNEACAPLRRAGYLRFQDEEIDSELEWAIVNSLDGCTAKTDQTETLLWRISPEITAFFLPSPSTASPQTSRLTQSSR